MLDEGLSGEPGWSVSMAYRRAAQDSARRPHALAGWRQHIVGLLLVTCAAVAAAWLGMMSGSAPVLPIVSLIGLSLAAVVSLYAVARRVPLRGAGTTAWDVAGAAALCGFAAAILSKPEQVLQLFGVALTTP
jgi:hypothetical protein